MFSEKHLKLFFETMPQMSPDISHEFDDDRRTTGFSSQIGTKLRDWAIGQAEAACYSWAALSSNDSKTL